MNEPEINKKEVHREQIDEPSKDLEAFRRLIRNLCSGMV
jgi:hypothetical protein